MRERLFSVGPNDLEIQFYRAGGPGGQHRNKVATACRITHRDSGAVGNSSEYKEQIQNKKAAFKRMHESPEFQSWHRAKVLEEIRKADNIKSAEQEVDEMLHPKNLKFEVKANGKWVEISWEEFQELEREFGK